MRPQVKTVTAQKGIPIPAATAGRKPIYPWATMRLNESFLLPGGGGGSGAWITRANQRYAPRKFSSRTVIENEQRVIRVWRIK